MVEQTTKIAQAEEGKRAQAAADYESTKTGNQPASELLDVGTNMAAELFGARSALDAGQLLYDRYEAAQLPSDGLAKDMAGFIGKNVQTADSFAMSAGGATDLSLTGRIKSMEKFFSGESEAVGDKHPPKTQGMQGKEGESIQVAYESRLLDERRFTLANDMIQRNEVRQAMQNNPAFGGPGGMGGGYSPSMAYAPKPPKIQSEDDQHSWAGLGGSA